MKRCDAEVVKSVARVFDILELFNRWRRALTAAEIGKALGYPPSSTIGLLKSMLTLGYLAFDCVEFTYTPTLRLPMITGWVQTDRIARDVESLMRRLHEDTGESVSLCMESDGRMQVLALSASKDITTFSTVNAVGDCAPLFSSVVGLTSLSTRSDDCVLQVASNLLRRPRYLRPDINIPESLKRIRLFRDSGFGVAYDLATPNTGALAWALASGFGKAPLVLGVWGPAGRIRACESRLISHVNEALSRSSSVTA